MPIRRSAPVANADDPSQAAELVRRLAEQGTLKKTYAQLPPGEERRSLWAGACHLIAPLVFSRVTERVERDRGHHRCAAGPHLMEPDCFDGFLNDLEAAVYYLFAYSNGPIHNLEGWMTSRLQKAVIDGNRRRRGALGAQQKPRVPAWLVKELDRQPWPVELARLILQWVGVPVTASTELWPLDTWTARRLTLTGDHTAGPATVAVEVERVLAAMRKRPNWYDTYVERPLGRKQTPVLLPPRTTDDKPAELDPLLLVSRDERDDALLDALAAEAIDVLSLRLQRGDDPRAAVVEVLTTVFGALPVEVDQAPGTAESTPDQVVALIRDEETLNRIVTTVLDLIHPEGDR
jgi:hypothetical protein